jgi:hypothetical protein
MLSIIIIIIINNTIPVHYSIFNKKKRLTSTLAKGNIFVNSIVKG